MGARPLCFFSNSQHVSYKINPNFVSYRSLNVAVVRGSFEGLLTRDHNGVVFGHR